MMVDKLDMATNNNVNFKEKAHMGGKINPIFYNMHNFLFYSYICIGWWTELIGYIVTISWEVNLSKKMMGNGNT